MSSPAPGRGAAVEGKTTTAAPAPQRHAGPHTPELLHPPAAIPKPAAAAAARIGAAARTAAAAGFAAARDGVKKLQQVADAPAGPSRAAAAAGQAAAAAMGGRLASDTGLAGLAEAAGHAFHDLSGVAHLGSRQQRVQLVKLLSGALCVATLGYAFVLAPNRLGLRHDLALLSRCFYDNALAFVLFNLLGLVPFLLNCLMWPALRSQGGQPAMWPHLGLSYVAGAFALLSYLVRWRPHMGGPGRSSRVPPTRLVGNTVWLQRQHEGRLMPALVTASIATLLALCTAATPATWAHFGFLLSHSKAVHVMLLDLSLLTLMSPFLVVHDARARGLALAQNPAGAALLGLAMLAVPLVGPGVYLLLRPISPDRAPGGIRAGVGFRQRRLSARVYQWLSQVWPFGGRVTPPRAQMRAAGNAARGRVVKGERQLRQGAAASAAAVQHAGSSAAAAGSDALAAARQAGSDATAAGSSAAANVVSAARVPLPADGQAAVQSVAGAAGRVAGSVWEGVTQGWGRVKQGAGRFLGGGHPVFGVNAAASGPGAAAGEEEELFDSDGPGAAGGTDSSDSTEHQHGGSPTHHPQLNFPAHNPLGPSSYFVTSVTPGGGHELLFAEDYNEAEADDLGADSVDDVTLDDDVNPDYDGDDVMGLGDEEGGVIGHTDDADDETFGGEGVGSEEEEEEGGHVGVRRGGYRHAKAVALQRLAELAHLEHPRTA